MNESAFRDLVSLAYATVEDGSRWTAFLQRLARATGGVGGSILLQDFATGRGQLISQVGISDDLARDYEHYRDVNVFVAGRPPDFFLGGVARASHDFLTDREIRESEYYQDYIRKMGIFHLLGVAAPGVGPTTAALISVNKPPVEHFTASEIRLVQELRPHVERSVQLGLKLQGLELQRAAALESLDRLDFGAVFLDGSGRILWANTAADEMLKAADGLAARRDGLAAANPDDHRRLQGLVAEACRTFADRGASAGGSLAVSRPSLGRPYLVLVAPFAAAGDLSFALAAMPRAVVFITDPESGCGTPEEMLREAYGLSPAEAQVARAIAEGADVSDIAERRGISKETVRTQLKSVLQKTGTSRQGELVRLLLLSGPRQRLAARS